MNDLLAEDLSVEDQNKDFLSELVGDNKKFKSPQDLAKGKYEADNYIKILERKLDQYRDDYKKLDEDYKARASLQELIDQQLKAPVKSEEHNQPIVKSENSAPSIELKDIDELVSNKLQQYEVTKRQQENLNVVKNKLVEHFGTKYHSAVKEQLTEIGLSESRFQELAREAPITLFRALGLDQPKLQENYQSPPRSSIRNDNFKPKGAEKRDWAWYQDLKQKDPNRYNDPQTNVQMMEDYMKLGSEFETGDFHRDFNRSGRR